MEEDEEIHFNRPESTPDTPRVSRNNTPDPEDDNQGETDYTVVLEMVKNMRDKLAALILDNTNIRAACDDLRRQCHSQGVAFGNLSRLVKQSREDQEETRAYTQEETRPYPRTYNQRSPSGGTGVRVRGGGRPGGGDVRRGGPSAVEHGWDTEGGGTTSVSGAATDVCSCALHGLRDATDRSPLRRSSTDAWSSIIPE